MGYRVKTQRGLQRVVPEEGLGAVRRAIRERNDGVALAMSFDPGTVSDLALYAHASAIMMGLLYARGWRRAQPLTAGGVPPQRGDEPIACDPDVSFAMVFPASAGISRSPCSVRTRRTSVPHQRGDGPRPGRRRGDRVHAPRAPGASTVAARGPNAGQSRTGNPLDGDATMNEQGPDLKGLQSFAHQTSTENSLPSSWDASERPRTS